MDFNIKRKSLPKTDAERVALIVRTDPVPPREQKNRFGDPVHVHNWELVKLPTRKAA